MKKLLGVVIIIIFITCGCNKRKEVNIPQNPKSKSEASIKDEQQIKDFIDKYKKIKLGALLLL